MKGLLCGCCVLGGLSGAARAADWFVDASGAGGSFTTISQAMAVAAPGDRILVKPGSYPAFHFNRGVEVIGLGASPSEVVLQRVDYHVTTPPLDYDSALSNVTVCGSGPANSTSISGNELGAGTLVLEGVVTCGGVYLRGGGEFYLMVVNSRFESVAGGGFTNTAFDFGGGIADFVDSRIRGSDAQPQQGFEAGTGLRVGGGATARLSRSEVFGGNASRAEGSLFEDGGDAVAQGFGTLPCQLRVSGGTLIRGGSGGPQGVGGAGIDVNGTILVGQASVWGGQGGAGPGPDYASSTPVMLGYDPHLPQEPRHAFAEGATFLAPGDIVSLAIDPSLSSRMLARSPSLDPPALSNGSPLVAGQMELMPGGKFQFVVPLSGNEHFDTRLLRRVYYQAFFVDPATGQIAATNPVALSVAP